MNVTSKALLVAAGFVFAEQAAAQITMYEDDGFQGHRVSADRPVDNFADSGFNDKASSVEVRGGTWQVCTDAYFQGQCAMLRPGTYPSLRSLGLNDQISSVRPIQQYGRSDQPNRYEGRSRDSERAWDHRYEDSFYEQRRDPDWQYRRY
jgi:beta/gamma crystallin